jgi:hypothetical protein
MQNRINSNVVDYPISRPLSIQLHQMRPFYHIIYELSPIHSSFMKSYTETYVNTTHLFTSVSPSSSEFQGHMRHLGSAGFSTNATARPLRFCGIGLQILPSYILPTMCEQVLMSFLQILHNSFSAVTSILR